jgi:dipeptidyl-peptidase 4
MKRSLYLLSLLVFTVLFSYAQGDKKLSMEDISTNYTMYPFYTQAYNEMQQLQWRSTLDEYTFIKDDELFRGGVNKNDKVLFDLKELNKWLEKFGFESVKRFPRISWTSPDVFRFNHKGQILLCDIKKKSIEIGNCCNANTANMDIHEETLNIAFTRDNNLFISINPEGSIPITEDEDENIVYGQAVHRREFGITKGTFWSPRGNYMAFYRKDESMVTDYPLMDINERVAENKPIKYPMAGMASHHVTLGIYDLKKKKSLFLETGEPLEQYLTNISWSPDEKYIFIAVLNRDQNHMKLNKYDVSSGKLVHTLFEEKHPKYVEPQNPMIFLKNDPEKFIWFSKRNGYQHMYLYSLDGALIEKLNEANSDLISFVGFDDSGNKVIYIAVEEGNPLDQHIYSLDLGNMEVQKLSSVPGVHDAILAHNGRYLLDVFSNAKTPRQIDLIAMDGSLIKTIYKGADPYEEYAMGDIQIQSLQADDGTELFCRITKPPDFDPEKKYPVIVYVYGGPHAQMITNSWRYGERLWSEYMAHQGYIMFTLDNRGSANRGLSFEQAIFRNMGTVEVDDQLKGIEYLRSLPYVDTARIGVHGWSYGGYMTISLMLKNPEVYKVGVSGAPVTDWKYYEIMYGERYMDAPDNNTQGYKEASCLTHVENLKGKLLIIHGTSDDTVVWQHSLKFIDACIKLNKQLDYFVYPHEKHSVNSRLHLNTKISHYFMDNL